MSKFKTGYMAKCRKATGFEGKLTEGKQYEVLHAHDQFIRVWDDTNVPEYHIVDRFEYADDFSSSLGYQLKYVPPKPKIIENERIVPTDIDETLVMHENPEQYAVTIEVEDPHHKGAMIRLGVNEPMIKVLKDEKSRGAFILAWSRSGFAWASTIIKALDLENHVDLIMTKPLVYLDDTPVEQWLKDRVWINPKTTYKKHLNK